jgi:rsbT co-antagonist protein RsbR
MKGSGMKTSDIDFGRMLQYSPDKGQLFLGEDRMLLFRQDSLATLRGLLFDQLGGALARSIFARFGYRCGQGDFEMLSKRYQWDSEMELMGAGPVMHCWEGIVRSEPTKMEFDRSKGTFEHTGIWRNSYEAEIHLRQFGRSSEPVCHSLAGYASGWGTAFFGKPLIAIETKCMGMGDAHCEVDMRPAEAWTPVADPWKRALEATDYSLSKELESKISLIQQQANAIQEMSTPVMEVWDSVLVLPIVGVVDTKRSLDIMNHLLQRITTMQAQCAIIDITGVEVVDTRTADYLLKVVRASMLLGTRCVLTGVSPAVAQTLVEIGADLQEVRTLRNLKEGLKDCLRYLHQNQAVALPTR